MPNRIPHQQNEAIAASPIAAEHVARRRTTKRPPAQGKPVSNTSDKPVVIVDPDRSYAELLADRLQRQSVARTVDVCSRGRQGLALLRKRDECLLITEHLLGDTTAFAVADALRENTGVVYVVLSHRLGWYAWDRLAGLGVAGCLLKSDPLVEILDALRSAKAGQCVVSRALIRQLTDRPRSRASNKAPATHIHLSPWQYRLLTLLAEGLSVKDAAERLRISTKAADNLKYRLMKRLQFDDRVQLTRFAIREGLIEA
jgi:DNA-binding NarL/FixJ family response regulator